jgi:hypothetical protein
MDISSSRVYILKFTSSSHSFNRLIDPYNLPILHVRRPGSDNTEIYKFEDDDPFLSEACSSLYIHSFI